MQSFLRFELIKVFKFMLLSGYFTELLGWHTIPSAGRLLSTVVDGCDDVC